jgi:hypothetical protein
LSQVSETANISNSLSKINEEISSNLSSISMLLALICPTKSEPTLGPGFRSISPAMSRDISYLQS